MKKMFTLGIAVALAVLSAAPAAAAEDPVPGLGSSGRWQQPRCQTVTGDGSVTFTRDEGRTIAPTSAALKPVVYTPGLVTLDRANRLLSVSNNQLSASKDAGCTWTPVGTVTGSSIRLAPARSGRAYAWDQDGNVSLVSPDAITPLTSPVGEVAGFGSSPLWGDRLRVADGDGQLYDSRDGGRTWRPIGVPALPESELTMVYTAAFDPYNLNHVVLGAAKAGARVTFDGGRTWRSSAGLSEPGGKGVNVFSATVSPAAPNVVYASGLNLGESDEHVPSDGRHIYRSIDGGLRFTPVVDQGEGITIPNGPLLAAHPSDPSVLYFVWGTGWSGTGTDVYTYDARRDRVTTTHNAYDRITSIAFNPSNPRVMYLGVAEEE